MEKYDGVMVRIGTVNRVVPALTIGQIQRLRPLMGTADDKTEEEAMDGLLTIVHTALSRNYPDLTIDSLIDDVDLNTLNKLVQIVMGVSGMEVTAPGEAHRRVAMAGQTFTA